MHLKSRRKSQFLHYQPDRNAEDVLAHRQKAAAWVPRPIADENSIFSSKLPAKKAVRKPGQAAIVSIDIFNLESSFKPHCIRNSYSTRNSHLFSEQQLEMPWRSSSKKPLVETAQTPKRDPFFHSGCKDPVKNLSFDLGRPSSGLKRERSAMRESRAEFREERSLFQSKKRVGDLFNSSSIQF